MEGVCVNCDSAGGSMVLENEQILRCIQQWMAPRPVDAHDLICTICWTRAQETISSSAVSNVGRNCVLCSRILEPRSRSHHLTSLRTNSQHHVNIRNIIVERLAPLQIRASHYICHPCWQRADRAALHYSTPSTSRASGSITAMPLRCANCDIHLVGERSHILNNDSILMRVQQQVTHRMVTATDYICDSCHTLFMNRDPVPSSEHSEDRILGHEHVCLRCGYSVARTRRHYIEEENNQSIVDVVRNWIHPRQICATDVLCHGCHRAAERAAVNTALPEVEADPVPQNDQRITLPNFSRASDTHRRCIFHQCPSTSQRVVPFFLRVRLIKDHKYYIPPNCRICEMHLLAQPWDELFAIENVIRSFTAEQIEDFSELLNVENTMIDFNNIQAMNDYMVWYWIGRSKEQFSQLMAELPQFPKKAISLGAYLMKLRTGDTDDRIATILKIARSTLSSYLTKAREIMIEYFVPSHIGLQHINRQEVASRNLYIPNSIFGNPGSSIEERKAIVIMDGTYIYVQKSSNYAYQKDTYSLHKYRNLVKPFMVVCCDGHIIDVLGPYAATKSDADIVKEEFDETKPMRQYFREGDVMILDRGFRDSIPFLQRLGYSVHYPLSLQPGEHQLSTEDANESRKVTLCRWVVEVVNGRFKRDYKLLRQEFFNRASTHLFKDFKVAAALINRFHPVLVNREDAHEIVSVIQEKMFSPNSLADFVAENNINRRRAQFESITVNIENIEAFPRMELNDLTLISLGIYQIKQARSYYGEHIRQDGSYIIEVAREIDEELLMQLQLNPENIFLLRGRIQSRHISNKTYFVYILIDSAQFGREAIVQYCCNCIVGRRTIGCCAHVMTIIWYLSYARHQQNIQPPAQFLDDILHVNTDE